MGNDDKPIKRFSHLTKEEIGMLQEQVDNRYRKIKRIVACE